MLALCVAALALAGLRRRAPGCRTRRRASSTSTVTGASFPARQHIARAGDAAARGRQPRRPRGARPRGDGRDRAAARGRRARRLRPVRPTTRRWPTAARPVWVVDEGPAGGDSAYTNTWAVGPLAEGQTRTVEWKLTAVAGRPLHGRLAARARAGGRRRAARRAARRASSRSRSPTRRCPGTAIPSAAIEPRSMPNVGEYCLYGVLTDVHPRSACADTPHARLPRVRTWSWTGLGVVLLCLLAAAPAHAAFERAPVELGPGDGGSPSVGRRPRRHRPHRLGHRRGADRLLRAAARRAGVRRVRPAGARRARRPARDPAPPAGRAADRRRRPRGRSPTTPTSRSGRSRRPTASRGPARCRSASACGAFDAAVLTADGQAVDLLAADTGENLFQRAPVGGPPTAAAAQPRDDARDGTTGVRLPRRPGAAAQRAHAGAARQPGRRLRLPDAKRRRPVRRRLLDAVAGGARDQGVGGAARRGRPARRVRDVRRPHPRPGLRRRAAGGAQAARQPLAPSARAVLRGHREHGDRPRSRRTARGGCTRPSSATRAAAGAPASPTRARASGAGSRAPCRCTRRSATPTRPAVCGSPSTGAAAASSPGRPAARPSAARVQRLERGPRKVTRPRAHSRRGCPPFPR